MFIIYRLISIIASLTAAFLTFVGCCILVTLGLFGQIRFAHFFIYRWAWIILFLCRAEIKVISQDKISKKPCLYIFNHSSLIDIPILFAAIPKMIMFGAKKELFYIPFFGWSMKTVGVLEIDRGDRPKAIETLKKAAVRIKNGESFILAAEGTRHIRSEIGEFKTGPFALAIDIQCDIQPVVIRGAFETMPRMHWFFDISKKHQVIVEILEPVSTVGITFDDRVALKEKIRQSMVASFEAAPFTAVSFETVGKR